MSLTCCSTVRIHVSVLGGKNVPEMMQHSENTCFCSMGQNLSLTCCSIVRIHVSVSSEKKCCSIVRIHVPVLYDKNCS